MDPEFLDSSQPFLTSIVHGTENNNSPADQWKSSVHHLSWRKLILLDLTLNQQLVLCCCALQELEGFFVLLGSLILGPYELKRKELRKACAGGEQGSGSLVWGPAKGPALEVSEMAALLCRRVAQEMALWNLRAEPFIPPAETPGGSGLWSLFTALQSPPGQTREAKMPC